VLVPTGICTVIKSMPVPFSVTVIITPPLVLELLLVRMLVQLVKVVLVKIGVGMQPPPKRPVVDTLRQIWPELVAPIEAAAADLLAPELLPSLLETVADGARLLHPQGRKHRSQLSAEEHHTRVSYLITDELNELEKELERGHTDLALLVEWVQSHVQPKVSAHAAGRLTERFYETPMGMEDRQLLTGIAMLKAALTELCYEQD
jgi:hypothetical protein